MPLKSADLNLKAMTGASNKPFDYLSCGLALVVSRLPDWEEMFVKPGYGISCDPGSPGSIAEGLQWFCDHPEEMRAMGERGREKILESWNYEAQFQPLFDRLANCCLANSRLAN
jgi:glycosyltransferase involved in cell wall biosynthesis